MSDVHILRAREQKAKRIESWLREHRPDIDAVICDLMDENGRDAIAGLAGCNPPSDATWEQVVSRMRRPVRPLRVVPSDPFSGIPS